MRLPTGQQMAMRSGKSRDTRLIKNSELVKRTRFQGYIDIYVRISLSALSYIIKNRTNTEISHRVPKVYTHIPAASGRYVYIYFGP